MWIFAHIVLSNATLNVLFALNDLSIPKNKHFTDEIKHLETSIDQIDEI